MGSDRDRAEGGVDRLKGKAKEAGGKLTDDESLEAEGRKDQAKGSGKQALGKAKDAGEKVKEGIKDATRRD
jgi:uncharacterized protein YjbJ (UPF0337 family)